MVGDAQDGDAQNREPNVNILQGTVLNLDVGTFSRSFYILTPRVSTCCSQHPRRAEYRCGQSSSLVLTLVLFLLLFLKQGDRTIRQSSSYLYGGNTDRDEPNNEHRHRGGFHISKTRETAPREHKSCTIVICVKKSISTALPRTAMKAAKMKRIVFTLRPIPGAASVTKGRQQGDESLTSSAFA